MQYNYANLEIVEKHFFLKNKYHYQVLQSDGVGDYSLNNVVIAKDEILIYMHVRFQIFSLYGYICSRPIYPVSMPMSVMAHNY